jgi:hypothetical protein
MNNEIVSLNLADLEVVEIEHRFEMAVALTGLGCNGQCVGQCNGQCVGLCNGQSIGRILLSPIVR